MINRQFVNVHQHSHYSLDGAATVEQLLKRTSELGCPYMTLTEHGNLNSAMELYITAPKYNIKPILGIELYVEHPFKDILRQYYMQRLPSLPSDADIKKIERRVNNAYVHLTVHFKDYWAYQYFCTLTPTMERRAIIKWGERKPICTWEELKQAQGHITIGSGCLASPVNVWIQQFGTLNSLEIATRCYELIRDIAQPENFIVELFPHAVTHYWKPPETNGGHTTPGQFLPNNPTDLAPDGDLQAACNRFVLQMAKKYNDPVVISLDAHYAVKSQKLIQDARLSNGNERWRVHGYYHILSLEEAKKHFNETLDISNDFITQCVENSYKWAEQFKDFSMPTNKTRWILNSLPDNWMPHLNQLISKNKRMDWSNNDMVKRLQTEMQVIAFNPKINLIPYFLTLVEITQFCKSNGILWGVRGSALGSLLLYVLGISPINPLKHDLSFERFLTTGRINANTLPDVDIDIASVDRDKVINFLETHYGDKFCQLSVDSTLKIKSSIKDAERMHYGKVRYETEMLCKRIPLEPTGVSSNDVLFGYTDSLGNKQLGLIETLPELRAYIDKNPLVWDTVIEMIGLHRQKSIHACGCVIADKPVQNYCPIIMVNGTKVTGFSPKSVEYAGLVKFDFLGLHTLADISVCLSIIKSRYNLDLDPWNLPHDDEVYKQFALGRTETVFQFDTDTVRPYLMAIRPKTIDDLAAVTALVRPGTLDALSDDGRSLAEVFVARCNGEEIKYIHPQLEPILSHTYGIQLFQEQTIRIFRDIVGYSAEEAEEVRRGIGKKDAQALANATERLRIKCKQLGWTEQQITLLVEQIMASARYAFNRSHATAYAYIAYACMYLKTHYPLEWWNAILSHTNKNDLVVKYWKYIRNFVKIPTINQLSLDFVIDKDALIAPITVINGVGPIAGEQLMHNAPYKDLSDFIVKNICDNSKKHSAVHLGIVYRLIIAGILDSLFPNPDDTLEQKIYVFHQMLATIKNTKVLPVPAEYIGLNALERFLIKKDLIPMYVGNLRELALPLIGGVNKNQKWYYKNSLVVDGLQLLHIKQLAKQGKWCGGDFYAVGYAVDEKAIQYDKKTKQATKLLLDIEGEFVEEVLWPNKKRHELSAPLGFHKHAVLLQYWSSPARVGLQRVFSIKEMLQNKK